MHITVATSSATSNYGRILIFFCYRCECVYYLDKQEGKYTYTFIKHRHMLEQCETEVVQLSAYLNFRNINQI